MDAGPRAHRRETRRRRVSSPSAANSGAEPLNPDALAARLARPGDMALDVLQLRGPTLVVHPERLGTAGEREAIEAGFHHLELRAVRDLVQLEDDQRLRLGGVIDLRVDRVRVPAEREEAFGLHPVDRDLELEAFVSLRGDRAPHLLAGREGIAEAGAKPCAEFLRVRDGAPDARTRGLEDDLLLDPIRLTGHAQPPGCASYTGGRPHATVWLRLSTRWEAESAAALPCHGVAP